MTTDNDRTYVMERVFNAPRELVFEAYSTAEHLKNWWGPKGWTLPFCEVDFRPGGVWLYCMKGPFGSADGEIMESWGKAVYQEIVEPERIVYKDMFVDAEGNHIEGTPEMVITVEFVEEDGKTRLISKTLFETAEQLRQVLEMGMEQGFSETLDRLEGYLEKVSA
jgi:uncharacterized protein YndB with AHSA1/START domain